MALRLGAHVGAYGVCRHGRHAPCEVARVVAVVATRGPGDVAAALELGAHDRLLYVVVAGVLDARRGSLAARRRNGPSPSGPRDEPSSDFGWTAPGEASSYRGRVSRRALSSPVVVSTCWSSSVAGDRRRDPLLGDDLEHPDGPGSCSESSVTPPRSSCSPPPVPLRRAGGDLAAVPGPLLPRRGADRRPGRDLHRRDGCRGAVGQPAQRTCRTSDWWWSCQLGGGRAPGGGFPHG